MKKTASAALAEKLAELFVRAERAAKEAAVGDDGGTFNFDTPAFRLDRVRDSVVQEASRLSGVRVNDFEWFGGRRWYWLMVTSGGYANRRTRAAEAATRVLKAAMAEIPGFHACGYYQAD